MEAQIAELQEELALASSNHTASLALSQLSSDHSTHTLVVKQLSSEKDSFSSRVALLATQQLLLLEASITKDMTRFDSLIDLLGTTPHRIHPAECFDFKSTKEHFISQLEVQAQLAIDKIVSLANESDNLLQERLDKIARDLSVPEPLQRVPAPTTTPTNPPPPRPTSLAPVPSTAPPRPPVKPRPRPNTVATTDLSSLQDAAEAPIPVVESRKSNLMLDLNRMLAGGPPTNHHHVSASVEALASADPDSESPAVAEDATNPEEDPVVTPEAVESDEYEVVEQQQQQQQQQQPLNDTIAIPPPIEPSPAAFVAKRTSTISLGSTQSLAASAPAPVPASAPAPAQATVPPPQPAAASKPTPVAHEKKGLMGMLTHLTKSRPKAAGGRSKSGRGQGSGDLNVIAATDAVVGASAVVGSDVVAGEGSDDVKEAGVVSEDLLESTDPTTSTDPLPSAQDPIHTQPPPPNPRTSQDTTNPHPPPPNPRTSHPPTLDPSHPPPPNPRTSLPEPTSPTDPLPPRPPIPTPRPRPTTAPIESPPTSTKSITSLDDLRTDPTNPPPPPARPRPAPRPESDRPTSTLSQSFTSLDSNGDEVPTSSTDTTSPTRTGGPPVVPVKRIPGVFANQRGHGAMAALASAMNSRVSGINQQRASIVESGGDEAAGVEVAGGEVENVVPVSAVPQYIQPVRANSDSTTTSATSHDSHAPVHIPEPMHFRKKDNSVSGDDKAIEKHALEWLNQHLASHEIVMQDLYTELGNGLNLIYALEDATGESVGKYNKRAIMAVHKIDNIAVALNFLSKKGVATQFMTPQDVVDGKKDKILTLFNYIVKRF
ncbi:hypothetical protein HDU98_009885 [Podochytrium sp. JEL0797]|nr:hypothetical protein HDU98_009885 [Podochytrium sp. JEL0797]